MRKYNPPSLVAHAQKLNPTTRTDEGCREEEIDWSSKTLAQLENNETLCMAAEVDSRVVQFPKSIEETVTKRTQAWME
jgi:hypothetical protein